MQPVKSILALWVLVFVLCSGLQAQRSLWLPAEIVYNDGHKTTGFIRYREASFFAYMKFKESEPANPVIISPYDITRVSVYGENEVRFISVHLPEKEHFTDASYFARFLAGDEICLVKTRFFYRTCSCNSRGSYRYGYFLTTPDSLHFVDTDKKGQIINHYEIDSCLNRYSYPGMNSGMETVFELTRILFNGQVLFTPENRGENNQDGK